MLSRAGLAEECVEGVIATTTNGLATWHVAIRLDAMFQAIQLPACIANLYSCLAHVDRDALTLHQHKEQCYIGVKN